MWTRGTSRLASVATTIHTLTWKTPALLLFEALERVRHEHQGLTRDQALSRTAIGGTHVTRRVAWAMGLTMAIPNRPVRSDQGGALWTP